MTKEEFHRTVMPGTLIYDTKRKVLAKVTRLFTEDNPSYAEYFDAKEQKLWGVFYRNVIIITPEKLKELKAKQAAKHDISSNNSDITCE